MTERILERRVLTEVADLNSAFLDLLPVLADASPAAFLLGLQRDLVRRIAALPAERRAEMARCSYTLFSLRLDDAGYWQPASEGRIPRGYRSASAPADAETAGTLSRFCLTALLFARQLVASSQFSARLTLGLPVDGCNLDAVPLVLMQHLASINTGLLRARLASHPRFWPDLVWCAENGNRTQRLASRMLGVHLLTGRAGGHAGSGGRENR